MLGNLYIILSILTFAATSLPIYSTHPTYFTFWMVYTSHDWGNAIIYNLVIAVALFLFRFVEAVVFGGMREDEAEVNNGVRVETVCEGEGEVDRGAGDYHGGT